MNFKHCFSALFIASAVIAAVSCKKDEDSETKPSLSGSLRFKGLPEYVSAVRRDLDGNALDKYGNITTVRNQKDSIPYHLYVSRKVFYPEGGNAGIGYYWKQNPAKVTSLNNKQVISYLKDEELDPDGNMTIYFKDSLYTCTVTCGAFADGYYDSSISTYTTIVDPGIEKSIKGAGYMAGKTPQEGIDFIYDKRVGKDGKWKKYYITEVGGRKWFSQNLEYNYEDVEDSGKKAIAFKDCEIMSGIYGRYYTHAQITDKEHPVCPEGWEVATEQDWIDLGSALGGTLHDNGNLPVFEKIEGITGKMMADATFNGKKMWTYWSNVHIDNTERLSILPAGWVIITGGNNFHSSSETVDNISSGRQYAAFILPDEADNEVYYTYLISDSSTLYTAKADKESFAASVRCVRKID